MSTELGPYVQGVGPSPCDVALVGEAPGLNESIYKRPFVGESGKELDRMLAEAGLDRSTMYVTNVFKRRPPDNDVGFYFTTRTDPARDTSGLPAHYKTKFLLAEYTDEVRGISQELLDVGARVVVALGATALWALLGYSKISSYVGTVHAPVAGRPFFVIPTYHPSAVLKNWSFRTTVVANLLKVHEALGKSTSERKPSSYVQGFNIKINPTLEEVEAFALRARNAERMAVDVETAHGQIRTISFSLGPNEAFVIPFWEPPAPSYWPTLDGEIRAWAAVRLALSGPALKIFHNGAYDIQYLWRVHGIPVLGPIADTMLAHHSMEPELPKSLGALSATYLSLPEWKTSREKTEKDEE